MDRRAADLGRVLELTGPYLIGQATMGDALAVMPEAERAEVIEIMRRVAPDGLLASPATAGEEAADAARFADIDGDLVTVEAIMFTAGPDSGHRGVRLGVSYPPGMVVPGDPDGERDSVVFEVAAAPSLAQAILKAADDAERGLFPIPGSSGD